MPLTGTVAIMATGPTGRVVEVAQEAERLGYSRCWLYDEGLVTRDVHVVASAVALGTKTILVGAGITNPYTRHPGTTATAVATLHELSQGRAFVGVGAGGSLTLRPLKLEWNRPARAVEEMVETMRRLFAGETVTHQGDTLTYRMASLPWGEPDIQIWVAGRGRRIQEVGARLADGVHLSYLHEDFIALSLDRIRATGAGRAESVLISYSTALVNNDADFERARAELTFRIIDSPPGVQERIGITEAEKTAIRGALASGGPSEAAKHVRSEWVERFTLVGSTYEIARRLSVLSVESGIDEFQVAVHDLDDAEARLDMATKLIGVP